MPLNGICWKIELFEGGVLDMDVSNPFCTNIVFKSSGALSMFNHTEDDTYHFNHLGLNDDQRDKNGPKLLDGRFTLKQNPIKNDYGVNITSADQSSSEYDIDLLLPSCDYQKCLPGEKEVRIDILPDRWPEETSWDLVNDCTGETVLSGNAIGAKACVPDDQYTFTIYDAYDDGICCEYGYGYYEVYFDDVLMKMGGDFKTEESISFGNGGCSCFGIMENKTIHFPVYSACWKIEFFNNGILSVDYTNPGCLRDIFTNEIVISSFSHVESYTAYFIDKSGWSGTVIIQEGSETASEVGMSDNPNEFEMRLSYPTCPLTINS